VLFDTLSGFYGILNGPAMTISYGMPSAGVPVIVILLFNNMYLC
jgi:hypothetical protein